MTDIEDDNLSFHDCKIESLAALLGLVAPPFDEPKNPFRQLDYILNHVKALGCQTIVLENHYIDRDYIEDYSLFYSKNYRNLPNFCRRLHFFKLERSRLEERFKRVLSEGKSEGRSAYKRAGAILSDDAYLGFCVIKHELMGSPVGRTVLRTYGEEAADNHQRVFSSIRGYKAHVLGAELKIRGLAFQQQDLGVSACATTALWSSLQQSTQFEKIRHATPAQITMLASQNILPFGRALPSEGLSVGQMCQAVQALGVSPNIFKVVGEFESACSYLHSVTLSGFAPVLVISSLDRKNESHAVTATGVKLDASFDSQSPVDRIIDKAQELTAIYIHDDRVGPYIMAKIFESDHCLCLAIDYADAYPREKWLLTHLLVPLHSKIRVTFTGLRRLATSVVMECAQEVEKVLSPSSRDQFPRLIYETKIQRATDYIEELVLGSDRVSNETLSEVLLNIRLSRYVGIIRVRSEAFGGFDLLIDTTSTIRNLNYLGAIFKGQPSRFTDRFSQWLSTRCSCPSVIDHQ
jgi:hypothetical protein